MSLAGSRLNRQLPRLARAERPRSAAPSGVEPPEVTLKQALVAAVLVIACWIIVGIAVPHFAFHDVVSTLTSRQEPRGQFGDQFGALTALFSGLALAGIVYTLLVQTWEHRANTFCRALRPPDGAL